MKGKNQNFFDFVLIDADKESIREYFDLISPMVTIGGVIVTDNMQYPEKYRQEMKKFSDHLKQIQKSEQPHCQCVMVKKSRLK